MEHLKSLKQTKLVALLSTYQPKAKSKQKIIFGSSLSSNAFKVLEIPIYLRKCEDCCSFLHITAYKIYVSYLHRIPLKTDEISVLDMRECGPVHSHGFQLICQHFHCPIEATPVQVNHTQQLAAKECKKPHRQGQNRNLQN